MVSMMATALARPASGWQTTAAMETDLCVAINSFLRGGYIGALVVAEFPLQGITKFGCTSDTHA